jgi:hypothetical protein
VDHRDRYSQFFGADPKLDVRRGREGVPDHEQAGVGDLGSGKDALPVLDLLAPKDGYLLSEDGFQFAD